MWFAEHLPADGTAPHVIGSVTLAIRSYLPTVPNLDPAQPPAGKGVVHWLAVLPQQRRQGIGRLLMATLEAAAWDAGFRQVSLETHAAWGEAVEFYDALGYRAEATK